MILWLSSFPKSGNTWLRSLITCYLDDDKNKTVFEKIKKIERFPSPKYFKGILDFDLLKGNELEICKYWIAAQEKINLSGEFQIFKTHNFGGASKGKWFTNSENTCGFIYLVRDPRSVAVSYAHHIDIPIEKSVEIICNENQFEKNEKNLIEVRSSWRVHYLSWKNRNYPKLIIKYEDLFLNTFDVFLKVLKFINNFKKIKIDESRINETIKICSFENLSKLEKLKGFDEREGKENFFRKGLIDEWKNVLPADLIKKIESNFKEEMTSLGYL
tara:strand:+ start:192 stop:1007 length:816 start_codon:yes stop_codon:yes gene_type:complete